MDMDVAGVRYRTRVSVKRRSAMATRMSSAIKYNQTMIVAILSVIRI